MCLSIVTISPIKEIDIVNPRDEITDAKCCVP